MRKVYIFSAISIGLIVLASPVFGQITNPIGSSSFPDLFGKIIVGLGTLIASLGTIMVIVAGILYLTSAGSPEKIGTAKKALIYAIAGIAIGLAAQAIVDIVKDVVGS